MVHLNITLIQQYLREVGSGLYVKFGQMDFAELCRSVSSSRMWA